VHIPLIIEEIQIVQLLMNYASRNNIILNIDEKIHTRDKYGEYADFTFKYAVDNSNFEIFKLFIEYAQNYGMLISLFKDNYPDYYTYKLNLLLYAVLYCKNIKIIKLIIEVA